LPRPRKSGVRQAAKETQSVNAPVRTDAVPRLEDFPHRLTENIRFADLDVNGHVNNAVYASYFETGRVLIVRDRANGLCPEGSGWVLVRLDIHFRAELHWPGTIELGLGVTDLGRTSVGFSQAVFSAGRCVASASSRTVMVDRDSRRPMPLPQTVIDSFQPWMLRTA
jgi:acyl-CoA thioester hydrolase